MSTPVSPTKRFLGRLGRGWLGGSPPTAPSTGTQGPGPREDSSPNSRKPYKPPSLDSLPEVYQTEGGDPLDEELRALPLAFTPGDLEALAEARTVVLESASEKLSAHVLANYDRFVSGVDGVTRVEADVQAAHSAARMARERLALALASVGATIRIAADTQKKGSLANLLQAAGQLQQVKVLLSGLRECQEEGEYAGALALASRCGAALEGVSEGVSVSRALSASLAAAHEETLGRMAGALAAVCLDFRPFPYTRVLEGYVYLAAQGPGPQGPEPDALGAEVQSAFLAAVTSASVRVVRGVLLTRAGCEARARSGTTLQDLVRVLPSDLFRTCLARLLQVLFDVLVSHHHMVLWHEAALEKHAVELARLQAWVAVQTGDDGEPPGAGSGAAGPGNGPRVGGGGWGAAPAPSPGSHSQAVCHDGSPTKRQGVTGPATLALRRGSTEREEVEARAADEVAWGGALRGVAAALACGRGLVWDEVARHVSALLSSPAAFEGEHFLQVMDWMRRFVGVGEAFSGVQSTALRSLLQRQSGNFFAAFHASNMEALGSMLDKESWTTLPVELPGLLGALAPAPRGDGEEGEARDAGAGFPALVAAGNPWRRRNNGVASPRKAAAARQRASGRRGGAPRRTPSLTLGFGGASSMLAPGLEVDERGHPLVHNVEEASPAGGSSPSAISLAGSGGEEEEEEDDDEDLHGDFIDEDSQSVRRGPGPGSGTGAHTGANSFAVTNSSWRAMKWMRDYARLMCTLHVAAPAIFKGLTELFDLYLLHVAACFDGPGVARLARGEPLCVPGTEGPDSRRLEAALRRILAGGGGRATALVSGPGSALRAALTSPAQTPDGISGHGGGSSLPWLHASQSGHRLAGPGASESGAGQVDPALHQHASITASGNMFGLVERSVATESLTEIAARLAAARGALASLLAASDSPGLALFYDQTLGAVPELAEHVCGVGVRLLLSMAWLPDAVGATNYAMAEPPTRHQPWVDQLLRQLGVFSDRLSHAAGLSRTGAEQAWRCAAAQTQAAVVAGVARVRTCSLEGRAALTLDVQGVAHGLRRVVPPGVPVSLARADAYVKAFYIPVGELAVWSLAHPEYSREQVLALAACMADSSGLKRKERAALLAQVESALAAQ